MRYNNYHKHTKYSSALTPDTHIDMEQYFIRAKELGHTNYFTTEHGFAGSVFEAKKLSKKYGIKTIFAMEIYIVENNQEKDRTNSHMVVIARTDKARKKMNLINSNAHDTGFYYKARWSLSDILSFEENEIYITTACIGGILKNEETINNIFIPIVDKFKNNLFIEIHNYNHEAQKKHNLLAMELSKKYDLPLIHANDSHYIHPEQHKDRLSYLKGKGISYDDEDSFILDYPDYKTIIERYDEQGIICKNHVIESLKNTLIFDNCEELNINDEIKMPTIYKELSLQERMNKLRQIVYDNFEVEKKKLPIEKWESRKEAIEYELNIIDETNEVVHTADYFLLNENIVRNAQEKYGGVLTKTGRGSGISFYINKLLGFSGLDRVDMKVPILPTRFLSKSRLIESKSLADFDFNTSDPEPFMLATKDILNEDGCHWMLSFGTMQQSEAVRNICRDLEMDYSDFNEIAKYVSETFKKASSSEEEEIDKWDNIIKFCKANGNQKHNWSDIINRAKQQVGAIVSVSRHPCSAVIMNENIREEIGLIRSGNDLCAVITSMEADIWKYLKNDYLTVSVVGIIAKTCKLIGIEVPDVDELISLMNDKAWKLYEDGITATLNQASTANGQRLVKQYKPKNYIEMSSFVAIIRPACASLLQDFLDRKEYDNGVDALNKLLKATEHRILYQEDIMSFLVWLGVQEDETYTILKKISKKVYHKPEYREEFQKLKETLTKGWIKNVGDLDDFDKAWNVIESSTYYLFNASHSLSVGLDSMYGAYLKANYPLEYFSVVLDMYHNDIEMTSRLVEEMKYFNLSLGSIKFRYSSGKYQPDKKNNSIYKGIASIKGLNEDIGNQFYKIRDLKYDTFISLLESLKDIVKVNKSQLQTLICLDFFTEFGKAKKLSYIADMYYTWSGKKTAKFYNKSKDEHLDLPFSEELIAKYSGNKSECQYSNVDYISIIRECESLIEDEDYSMKEKINFQQEYLGYLNITDESLDKRYIMVTNLDTKYSPRFDAYCLNNGKVQSIKVKRKPKRRQPNEIYFEDLPFKDGDILYASKFEKKAGVKKVGDDWVNTGEYNFWMTKYRHIREGEI